MLNFRHDKKEANGTLNVIYKTTTGRVYPLEVGYDFFPVELVPVDRNATIKACKNGCSLYGRNGGCPPFSPRFSKICRSNFLALYVKIYTKDYPPKVIKGPYYSRWVFVETFMTALTNRIGRCLADELDGFFLSSGHCTSCKPKRCAVKDGHPCIKPEARTYSLEAGGVLVTGLMKKVFGIELQWWRPKEPDYIPEYMLKVIGLTRDREYDTEETEKAILSALKKDRILSYEYNSLDSSFSFPST